MPHLNKATLKQHWPARQRGAVTVLITAALIAVLAMAGLALDGGHLLLNKTRLQNAVDAAALSGAKTLSLRHMDPDAGYNPVGAALHTLELNAREGDGNGELARAIADLGGAGEFAEVYFSSKVDQGFGPSINGESRYVRVTVLEYGLVGFFWNFLKSGFLGGDGGGKRVAAVAVAGITTAQPCKIDPLLVCGDPNAPKYNPDDGVFWGGYSKGDVTVLKSAAGDTSPLGPGNFQLLDFGSGGKTIRDALAGGVEDCSLVGDTVITEPGNKVGPVAQGLNERFWVDYITEYDKSLELVGEVVEYDGESVLSNSDGGGGGKNSEFSLSAGGVGIFDYKDWVDAYDSAGCPGCDLSGEPYKRILNVVVGDCSGKKAGEISGKSEIPVLGVACYFTLQPVKQSGLEAQIFGQFVEECNSENVPSQSPLNAFGHKIIQLYKAGSSPDS